MSLAKSCHRCIKPYDECICHMFNPDGSEVPYKGLEGAYDQPKAKSLEEMNLLLRLDKALDELNEIRNQIAGVE